jgi:uncharacterized protein (TIGR03790 family)
MTGRLSINGWLGLALVALGTAAVARAVTDRAQQILIVYNETQPESRALGEYYAKQRGVPTNQVCGIRVRAEETITRGEFNYDVREPILRFMLQQKLMARAPQLRRDPVLGDATLPVTYENQIACVVLMYGVPLRIGPDPELVEKLATNNVPLPLQRNEASVDSELALLPTAGAPAIGVVRNPWYGSSQAQFGFPLNNDMVLVARLDGPDPATVRRMIDEAIATERYGLLGRAYFDARGIREAGYADGDEWIRNSCRQFREAGFECELDENPEVFDEDYPMSDVAVYAGWYEAQVTGPFRRPTFRFRPGAIAYHIHSSSATTLHSANAYWVGPLLAKGAAVSFGNVYEPYLSLTPRVDTFFKRLLVGGVFSEAGWASQPALSWQTTFVGDPLYRPFGRSLEEQIHLLELDRNPDLAWAYLRKVNLLPSAEAEELCRQKAEALHSGILFEKLGDMLTATKNLKAAIEAFRSAETLTENSYALTRIERKLAAAYAAHGQPQQALAVYEGLIAGNPSRRQLLDFYERALGFAMAAGETAKSRAFQEKIDNLRPAQHKDIPK